MSATLRFFESGLQVGALLFMGVVYVVRLVWLFRFRSRRERTFPAGHEGAGVGYSLMNVVMPWAMESTRKRPWLYAQFVVFHLGVAAAIAATFIIPYRPTLFAVKPVALAFQAVMAAAFLVGVLRLVRRLREPTLRLVSSADDYLSLALMIVFFAAGVLAVPNRFRTAEWTLLLFFGLTAFFLIYVPFSKICHYLYYPLTRYYLGRTMGHRGVLPPRRQAGGPRPSADAAEARPR